MVIDNSPFMVGKFEKVSYEEFLKTFTNYFPSYTFAEGDVFATYEDIALPERKTVGSAGYDFCMPVSLIMSPMVSYTIPTGIKCKINAGWWLSIMVRSSLGTKYGLSFENTIPVIDSDYYNCEENEGHILLKVSVKNPLRLNAGDRFCQGIFLPYGITEDDAAWKQRYGGIGSTGNK